MNVIKLHSSWFRLKAELERLRQLYEEETQKVKYRVPSPQYCCVQARTEYMYLHSRQLGELQQQLSGERAGREAGRAEVQ